MRLTIKIDTCPFYEDEELFTKSQIEFGPGVTVLVGCNGSGKTTMLHQIKRRLDKEGIPVELFDNYRDGGSQIAQRALWGGDTKTVAMSTVSSEGERIMLFAADMSRKIGAALQAYKGSKEFWFLIDAIDSGWSIDNILDAKKYLFDFIIEHEKDADVYIVVSANAYEMCVGYRCLDVISGEYVNFKSYNKYREFILKSRKLKVEKELDNDA